MTPNRLYRLSIGLESCCLLIGRDGPILAPDWPLPSPIIATSPAYRDSFRDLSIHSSASRGIKRGLPFLPQSLLTHLSLSLSLPNSSTYLGGIVAGIPRDARLLGSFQFLTLLTTLGGIVAGNPGDARPLGCSQTSLTLLPPLGGIVAGIPGNARPLGRSQTFLTLPSPSLGF